jgi:serine O-acetyltransferase
MLPRRAWQASNVLRTIREDLETVMQRDPSITSLREAALHPTLPAVWLYRIATRLHAGKHPITARLISNIGRLFTGVEIHPGAHIGRRFFVDHGIGVVIGQTAEIGDDVTLYHQVTLGAVGWWRDNARAPGERRHPRLGDRVVVGANATLIGPLCVGDDAVIGAHALVLTDVESGQTVRGIWDSCQAAKANGSAESSGQEDKEDKEDKEDNKANNRVRKHRWSVTAQSQTASARETRGVTTESTTR